MRKLLALLLCLVLTAALFGCTPGYKAPDITFTAAGATGYEWNCTVSDAAVAACEATTEVDGKALGSPLVYTFTFTGVTPGETTAAFTFGRSWENAFVKCECLVTVDDALHVTLGELSEKTLMIDVGSPDYEIICFDTDVLSVVQDTGTGLYEFAAVTPGTTRVDFFYLPEETENADAENADAEEFSDRSYEITVDEEGMFYWLEEESDESGDVHMGFTDYTSAEALASETGLFVPRCKEMKACDYTYIDELGLAYMNFTWDGVPVAYAAGAASLDGLTDDTTTEKTVANTTVYITSGKDTDVARTDVTAAWKSGSTYCYIVSQDEGFTQELMVSVLSAVIEAQSAE